MIYCGHNQRGSVCLNYLDKIEEIEIPLVIGHPQHDTTSSYYHTIENEAESAKLNYIAPENINVLETRELISKIRPDCMVLVGYSKCLLRKEIYNIPKYGTLNVHASLLPNYRGASPLNWALINGETQVGFSIIKIDEGIDTGPILYQEKIEVAPTDNISTITTLINQKVGPALVSTVIAIEEKLKLSVNQVRSEGSFYSKRFPKDGRLDFKTMSSQQIINMVRALCDPYPGAFFRLCGQDYVVEQATAPLENFRGVKGRIAKIFQPDSLIALCQDGGVHLKLKSPLKKNAIEAMKWGLDIDGN